MTSDMGAVLPKCVLDIFQNHDINACDKKVVAFKIGASWCGVCKRLDKYLTTADAKRLMADVIVRKIDVDLNEKAIDCFEKNGYIDTSDMYLPSFVSINGTQGFLGLFRDSSNFSDLLKNVSNSARMLTYIARLKLQTTADPLDIETRRGIVDLLFELGRFKEAENECMDYIRATKEASKTMCVQSQEDLLVAQIKKYYMDHSMQSALREFTQKISIFEECTGG